MHALTEFLPQRALLREAPEVHQAERELRAVLREGPDVPAEGELRRDVHEGRLPDAGGDF